MVVTEHVQQPMKCEPPYLLLLGVPDPSSLTSRNPLSDDHVSKPTRRPRYTNAKIWLGRKRQYVSRPIHTTEVTVETSHSGIRNQGHHELAASRSGRDIAEPPPQQPST